MQHIPYSSDTICAVATAPGSGGIAVIRVSGSEAIGIVDQIFHSRELRTLERAKDRTAYFGHFQHEGKVIDEGLVTCFRSPGSYTGEDVVELSCHGSLFIQQALLEALTDQGCRMAAPGEYTRRAYLNGKMDLSRSEAVADLIASESEAQHRMALTQMKGGYSAEFRSLRERLIHLTSLMELELDFSEEDVNFADRTQLLSLLDELTSKIASAHIVLLVVDVTRLSEGSYLASLSEVLPHLAEKPLLVLLNKTDLIGEEALDTLVTSSPFFKSLPPDTPILPISARAQTGLEGLRKALIDSLALPHLTPSDLVVSNARHHALLKEALTGLRLVRQGLMDGLSTDLLTPDLRRAITSIGEVTGSEITSDSILHNIFAHFCIGK